MSRALIASLLLCAVLTFCRSTTNVDVPRPAGDAVNRSSSIKDGPIIYVAFGDSTGAGVGAREGGYVARIFNRLLAKRPDSRLINRCVSGATTADVIHYQLEEGIDANASLITLGIGINDIGHGVSLQQFAKNYEEDSEPFKEQDSCPRHCDEHSGYFQCSTDSGIDAPAVSTVDH